MTTRILAILFLLTSTAAQAQCYADYKAKRDDPLRLHYGVIELSGAACESERAARQEIADRIARDGWTLLSVESIFDRSGLDERKASAGENFLRY